MGVACEKKLTLLKEGFSPLNLRSGGEIHGDPCRTGHTWAPHSAYKLIAQ